MRFSHYLCLIVEEMKSIVIGLFLIIIVDLQCPQKSLRGESLQLKL